jgi:hypothetical protein
MMEPVDWDERLQPTPMNPDPIPNLMDVEHRLVELERKVDLAAGASAERDDRVDAKQDALYAEIHAVRLEFAKLVEGVMGAMTSNPLLSRLLGGSKKER